MKKTTVIIWILVAIILGVISGIMASILGDRPLKEAQINEIKKANELIEKNLVNVLEFNNTISASSNEKKLSPNAILYFEEFYNECNHTIVKKQSVDASQVNKTEEEIKKEYEDWEVKVFTENQVRLYREISGECNEHYLITVDDNNIVVHTIDDEGNTSLKEVTYIPIMYLPKEDLELLKHGIRADGDADLAKKLEDFE